MPWKKKLAGAKPYLATCLQTIYFASLAKPLVLTKLPLFVFTVRTSQVSSDRVIFLHDIKPFIHFVTPCIDTGWCIPKCEKFILGPRLMLFFVSLYRTIKHKIKWAWFLIISRHKAVMMGQPKGTILFHIDICMSHIRSFFFFFFPFFFKFWFPVLYPEAVEVQKVGKVAAANKHINEHSYSMASYFSETCSDKSPSKE